MGKWFINTKPTRNTEKDEEKDKLAQQLSDPLHQRQERDEEKDRMAQKLSNPVPHSDTQKNNSQPTKMPESEIPDRVKSESDIPNKAKTETTKSNLPKTSGKWYFGEGTTQSGFKMKTFESGEARKYRLGDEDEQEGQQANPVDNAGQQVEKTADEEAFDRYAFARRYREEQEKKEEEAAQRSRERQERADISKLTKEQRELLNKYNEASEAIEFSGFAGLAAPGMATVNSQKYRELSGADKKDEYKKDFMESIGSDDEELFGLYLQYARAAKNAEMREQDKKQIDQGLESKNALERQGKQSFMSAASVGLTPIAGVMAGVETLRHIGDADPDAPIDTNSQYYRALNMKNDIREDIAEQRKEGKSGLVGTALYDATNGKTGAADAFLYQTRMSMADSAVYMAMGAGVAGAFGAEGAAANTISQVVTLPGFGMESYSTTLEEAQDRGLSKDNAIKTAAVAGIAEMVTEIIPLENFWKIAKSSGLKGTKKAIIEALKQAGLEGAEELEADIINLVADTILNGDKSEYNQNVQELMKAENPETGRQYTREEAEKAARTQLLQNMAIDTLGGTISGAAFGGGALGIKFVSDTIQAKNLFEEGNYGEFAEAIDTDKNSYSNDADYKNAVDTKKYAEELAAKQEAGEKVSTKEKRHLYQMIEQTQEDAQKEQENPTPKDVEQSTDNVAQVAPVQSDITAEETATRMSQAKTADELGAIYNEAKNSTHEDARRTADRMYDTYAGKLQSQGVTAEELRRGRISEQEAYEAGRRGENIGTLNPRQLVAYNQGANDAFKEESALPAKDARATTNSGTEIEVSKIVDTTEGKIETSDGKVLPMTDIHFNDRGMQKLYNAAMEYHSPQTAQLVIESYPAGSPVGNYITNANRFYMAGQLGRESFKDVLKRNGIAVNKKNGMTEEAARKLYEAGREQGEATKSVDTRPNKVKKVKGVVNDNRTNKTDTPIKKFANAFALKFGIDIDLSDQMEANVNGMFQKNASRVVLNIENDNLWNTLMHEIGGEFTLAYNKNGMEEIQNLILEYFIETQGEDWINDKVRRYQNAYQKVEGTKSVEDAYAELVNDALAGIFSTPEGMTELAEWLAKDQKNNVQTNTVLERIARWIQDLIDSLKKYISSHPNMSEASRKTLQMEADRAAGLRARILEEWQKAIDNYNATEKVDETVGEAKAAQAETAENTDQGEIRHSVKITLPDGREVEYLGDVLDMAEHRQFMSEIDNHPKSKYEKAANGDVIVPINNKLVYTDFNRNDPGISQIIVVNTDDYTEIAGITDNILDAEKRGLDYEQSRRAFEGLFKKGSVIRYTNSMFGIGKEYDRQTERGKGRSDAYHSEQQQRRREFYFESEDAGSDLNTSGNQKHPKSKFSLSISNVDSDGRMLSAEQQAYFKDSKIRDDQGRLITVYHGTPYGGFTVFKNDLNYFTPSQEYAERYHSPSASSIRGKYDPATNEMTYKGYLNITHPFDITDPETREVFINDYVKGGWSASINPSLSDAEIEARISGGIDWTEADNIKEFIDENELNYDGIILDEGAGGGYGEEVVDHGISYVTFNSNQFKNADNKKPTDNADIRFSVKVDSDGNSLTPGQQRFFRDSKLRDDQGQLKVMYHGTRFAGFTTFNLSQMDDGMSIFLTDNSKVAKTYSGTEETYEPDRDWSFDELEQAISYQTGGDWEIEQTDNGVKITELGYADEPSVEHIFKSVRKAQDYFIDNYMNNVDLRSGESAGNYKVYGNATNPLIVDAQGEQWNNLPVNDYDKHYRDVDINYQDGVYEVEYRLGEFGFQHDVFRNKESMEKKFGKIPELNGFSTAFFNDIYLDKNNNRIPTNTRDYARYARENGYDSVIFENLVDTDIYGAAEDEDTASTVAIMFSPNQVKSVNNENPTEDPDIRYSINIDDDRVFYAGNTEVVKNPTPTEYAQMREDILNEYPWLRGTGEPLFRHTFDEEGNEYYWEANGGLHAQIEPQINRRYNTRTSQQYQWWTKEDKDDYPVNYDRYYSRNEDNRFSLDVPIEETDDLIAIHNLSTEQMMETLKLGGFPMPSIAITRADMGHNMYGNISVLFRKDTIDPKGSRYNKAYSGDAYTPEFPSVGYKINSDKIMDIRQQVKDLIGKEYELFTNTGLDTDNAKDILERNSGNVVDGYGNKDALKYAFTKAKGIDIDIPTREENLSGYYDNDVIKYLALMFTPDQALHDYQNSKEAYKEFKEDGRLQKILDKINSFEKKKYSPKLYEKVKTNELEYFKFDNLLNSIVKYLRHGVETKLDRLAFSNSIDEIINNNRAEYEAWLNDLFDGIIEKKGIRNNKDMFTPSGNRRKWESLYDDFTLMNIVNAMRKEDQTGKGFGGYSFFGSVNREFESIDDIRSEKDRLKLIDQDEYSNLQKEIANELHDIAVRLKPGMGYDEYSIMSDIAEAVAKRKTRTGVKSFLSQWYKVSDKDIADIMELVGRASKLPTGYFEAKPQRAVGLDEIASVVVPDLETDLIDELKDKSIPYKTYKAGDKESRKKAVNSVEDIRFSLSGIDTDILNNPTGKRYSVDDDWMDEFTSMSDEELEQMVRETIIDDSPDGSYTSYRANIDQTVENLSRMLEAANAPLRGHEVNRDRIAAIADQIKDHYSSHISKQVLTDNLVAVFDYLQHNDNIDYNDITRVLSEVAAPVLEKTDIDVPEEYARFKDLMRGYKIKLTDKQKQELSNIYGSYETARKQNFGRLTFSDDGESLDSIWSELVEKSAGLLNEGAYEGEQITQLIDAMDICSQGHSVVEVERGQDLAQASIDLAMEIMEEYYKAEAEAIRSEAITGALESGMAGKAAKETIDRARAKMQEQQKEFRKKTKEEYETRIKYLEKQLGDIDYYKAMAEYNEKVKNIHDQKSQAEIHRLIEELAKTRRQMATQAKALNKNSVEDYKESQERIKARKEITRLGNNLMNRILNPTTKQHVPTDLQKPLADFLSGIDFVSHRAKEDSKSTKSWREKMQSLSIYLSQLEAGKIEDDVDYLSVLDPDLNSDIRDFIKETEGYAKVSQLDTKELQKLESILKRIQASINKVDKALANQQYERVSDLAVATKDELRDRKPHKATYRGLETLNSFFNIAELDPTSYFYEMGEAAGSIMQSFRDGFDKRVWHLKSIQDYVDGIKNEVGLKNFADWRKEEHTFKTNEGDLTLTTAQIMSLYCLMNRDQAREHIVRGGLKAGDREKGFFKKSVSQLEPIHITPEEYSQIVNTLTNDQKYIASKLQQFMATECAKWGNNVTRRLYGYEKFTDKDYFPINVDKNTAAANDKNTSDTASMWHLRNMGFTKDLAPHAKNAVILNDIFSVFTQHTTEMATYDGLVLPLTDAMRWYNFRAVNEVFTEANDYGAVNNEWNIQREIERVLGKPGQQYFTKLIKDINGMNRTDGLGVISKFMGNYKAAAVAANMRVVIQQPTAYARAFAEMDARDLTAALASAPLAGKYAKKAQDNCAIALWKAWGFYETYMGQSMEQIITGDSTVTEKIKDIAAIGAQKADDWTWGILWRACEIETSRKYPNLKYNSKEYLDAVAERMSYVVDRTQVVDSVLHRSDIMRRQDGLAKTFTAFMAEPTKSVNMIHRALVSKDKKKIAKALAAFLTSNLLVAFFAGLIDAARHDDDEHSYQELLLEAFKKNAIDNLNPINLFPYVKDLYAILETTIEGGYQSSNTDMSLAGYSQTVQAMWNIYKYVNPYVEYTGKKTPYGLAKDLTRGVSQLTGIPVYNLWRDIEAGHNMLAENWATTTNTNYGALHKAITSGEDIEGAVNKMIEDGVDPGTIKKHLTSKYKEAYIEASEEDRAEMKEKLLRAYNALGDDSYDQKIDGWVNKAAGDTAKNDSQDSAPVQEYTSDYAGVYQAIDQGGNIQAEVQSMLASGKEKSGVKSAITRHYKDDYLSATGSDKANLKNTLIKAYTAAGYTRDEAIKTIESW